jgi:hypothetical protein
MPVPPPHRRGAGHECEDDDPVRRQDTEQQARGEVRDRDREREHRERHTGTCEIEVELRRRDRVDRRQQRLAGRGREVRDAHEREGDPAGRRGGRFRMSSCSSSALSSPRCVGLRAGPASARARHLDNLAYCMQASTRSGSGHRRSRPSAPTIQPDHPARPSAPTISPQTPDPTAREPRGSCVHHFDDADVTELLDHDELVAAMATAFTDLGSGRAATTVRVRARTDDGMASAMAAAVPSLGVTAGRSTPPSTALHVPRRAVRPRRSPALHDGRRGAHRGANAGAVRVVIDRYARQGARTRRRPRHRA